jgi:steroid delta-isomerase-like uncharacterized protein
MTTTGAGIDQAFAHEFAQRWLDAWNSHQPERVLELMAEDIVYEDSAAPETMRGHAEVRPFIDSTWRAFPDMRFELLGLYPHASEPKAALHWRSWATNSGPIDPPGLRATGKSLQLDGVDLHEYRDGKIARLTIVFDMAEAMRQLGSLPQPGSRGERVMVGLGNLQSRLRGR